MERPAFSWVLVGWLCAAAAAFVALFRMDATDDYAGWVPVIVVVQVPAFLALRPPWPEGTPSGARRWGLALPAALVTGMAVFWTMVPIGYVIWKPEWLEFRPLLLGLGVGLVAMIVAGVGFGRRLRAVPHPRSTRLVLIVVTALGAIGLGAMALRLGGSMKDPALWLVVGVPVLWAAPLWLLLALEPPREPPIPRVIVSR